MGELLIRAAGVLMAVLFMAYLAGRLFRASKIRKRIMIGAVLIYLSVYELFRIHSIRHEWEFN